jgi:glycosyltransferase involved in cell wall biosynthesis
MFQRTFESASLSHESSIQMRMTTPQKAGSGAIQVAHLVSHPIQYFAPLYRELARRPEIDLTVYFYSDETVRSFYDQGFGRTIEWDVPLVEGYRHVFCKSSRRTGIAGNPLRRHNFDIVRQLKDYDVVWAHGYAHLTAWLAFLRARRAGKPFLLREEQTLLRRRSLHVRLFKAAALGVLFSGSWGLYIGEENRRYFQHYGIPAERLFPARYCVDNAYFQHAAAALRPERARIRAELGISDDAAVVLFCGKLTPKKQPLRLVEAFAQVEGPCWLLLVGDGEQRKVVESSASPNVVFAGFMGQRDIVRAYAAADIFVLPSAYDETWGLVVNEAMNFSLPIVASNQVGCVADLVSPGWNGFVVPDEDTAALTDALEKLIVDPSLRAVFGKRSLERVDAYSIEACADGIVRACLAAAHRNGKPVEVAA